MGRSRHHLYLIALASAGALVLAACGNSSSPSKTSTSKISNGGSITYALDEDVAGFNINQADDDEFVLQEIMDQVWPSVYVTQPNATVALNTELVTSAKVTSTSPQTVVYQINPKAVWSDGTPISASDFIYNWQAQSGNPKYKDVGGKAFLPAGTSGYNQISSVTGSNGGKTVTVVFSKPFADWQALFGDLMPAHIAEKVGFNNGFQTFGSAVKVSGGPYEIQSYTKGEDLVEVPNPKYWGAKPHLSKIIYRFILDDSQDAPAISSGEVDIVNPVIPSVAYADSIKSIPNFTASVLPGLEFQHIDFNESNPYLAKLAVREAIALGTNRTQLIQRIVAPIFSTVNPADTSKAQVLNNRIYMPIQPTYQNTSSTNGAFDPTKAKQLLKSAGMTMGSDGYFQPSYGPLKGKDFSLSISTTSGVPVRQQIEELFQADMKAIGIKINIQNYDANTLFGTVGPKGEFDLIEFAWVGSPFASGNQPIYCSYTNTAVCGENWDHYADPQVDKLFNQALSDLNPTTDASLYNQIDGLLWKDMATLPLFENPVYYGYSTKYSSLVPNPTSVGIPWNAQDWALKA
ncbi:MAG TPA: ABC transporter family substrate-binding protein [Streptosporangiaceae bacterium]|nr:ABC transporter family substrate-binding protein [Streptosporangiaceae bacterium]